MNDYKAEDPFDDIMVDIKKNSNQAIDLRDIRDKEIINAVKLNDTEFKDLISKEKYLLLAIECLDSDNCNDIKFAARSIKYIWDILEKREDFKEIVDMIIYFSKEWLDSNDCDLQDYILDIRELLLEKIGYVEEVDDD